MAQSIKLKTPTKYAQQLSQVNDSNISWQNIYQNQVDVYTSNARYPSPWYLNTQNDYLINASGADFYGAAMNSIKLQVDDTVLTPNIAGATETAFYNGGSYPDYLDDMTFTLADAFAGLTANALKKSSFTVLIDVNRKRTGSVVATAAMRTLKATGFGFSVPKEIVFTGATAELLAGQSQEPVGGGVIAFATYMGGFRMSIAYEYTGKFGGEDSDQGYVRIAEMPEPTISQEKTYQYNVYKNGQFLNEYKGITSEPSIKNSVNQLPGELNITIARDLEGGFDELDAIAITGYESDPGDEDLLLTNTQEPLLATIKVSGAVGAGTDIDKNNYIDLKEYYGGFESLLTSDGEEILTSDLEPLFVENGYPLGHSLFKGFISKYRYGYNAAGAYTGIKVLSHVDEYNNIVLESEDTEKLSVVHNSQAAFVVNDRYFRDSQATIRIGQSFSPSSTFKLSAVSLFMRRGGTTETEQSQWPSVTVIVRQGLPNGSGTILGTSTKKIDNFTELKEHVFSFEEVTLTSGTTYSITVQPTTMGGLDEPSGTGYVGFAVAMNSTNPYAGGAQYSYLVQPYNLSKTYPDPGWGVNTGYDLGFKLWERGGNTTVTMNSQDPAEMLRKAADYATRRGSQIRYTDTSIVNTGTIVSGKFNTNKISDVVAAVLKYSPSDWYTFYDPAELTVNLQPRPEVVKHWFELGKNIEEVYFEEDIEDLVNEVYFSGGATVAGGTNLMKRFVDALSQSSIRRGLAIISDNRVTDVATATIMSQAEINRKKEAVVIGEIRVLRKEYEEVVNPGELCGFMGFGNHIDFLRLQAVQTELTPDRLILKMGVLLPPVSKRVEDIRRNLQLLEMQNNPTTPS